MWIHQNIASGPTRQRWKDREVFVYERQGPPFLLVGLNRNKHSARTLPNVATAFGPHQLLHDYAGHAGDITTDASGQVTLTIPRNADGHGFVCYSVPGIGSTFSAGASSVTQVFEGAPDLDIKPAQAGATIHVCRLWLAKGSPVTASLSLDASGWLADSQILLTIMDPLANPLATRQYLVGNVGTELKATTTAEGWHIFTVHAQQTPASNPDPRYKLSVTYG
jgi:alpha-amylase